MRRQTQKEKELADNATLLRAWRKWHRERLSEAMVGPHGVIVVQVVEFLKMMEMTPAAANALLALMRSRVWSDVGVDTRFILLHEINSAITRMREKNNMEPFVDGLPGQRATVFQTIKQMLFP